MQDSRHPTDITSRSVGFVFCDRPAHRLVRTLYPASVLVAVFLAAASSGAVPQLGAPSIILIWLAGLICILLFGMYRRTSVGYRLDGAQLSLKHHLGPKWHYDLSTLQSSFSGRESYFGGRSQEFSVDVHSLSFSDGSRVKLYLFTKEAHAIVSEIERTYQAQMIRNLELNIADGSPLVLTASFSWRLFILGGTALMSYVAGVMLFQPEGPRNYPGILISLGTSLLLSKLALEALFERAIVAPDLLTLRNWRCASRAYRWSELTSVVETPLALDGPAALKLTFTDGRTWVLHGYLLEDASNLTGVLRKRISPGKTGGDSSR